MSHVANSQPFGGLVGGGNYSQGGVAVAHVSGLGGWCSGVPVATPPHRDPLEYATEVALIQPEDPKWRRFQHALFRAEDVMEMCAEGSGSIAIQLRMESATRQEVFTLPFDCADPVQWFAEHVMKMNFPNARRAT